MLNNVAITLPQIKPYITPFMQPTLFDVVQRSLAGSTGKYSIFIKNLKTNEEYAYNSHEQYDAASLYKLWVMGAAYKKINDGTLKRKETLSDSIANINKSFNIASHEAELREGSITVTTMSGMKQMITISHNYSALILSRKVGTKYISDFIKELGLSNSNFNAPPQTTAEDIALFLEKLYKGEIVNQAASQEMIELMKQQTFDDRIPKYLPKNIKVANKTGELGWVKHDAGIVFTPEGNYIFVALSKSDNPQGAAERIAQVSKAVYDYFQKE